MTTIDLLRLRDIQLQAWQTGQMIGAVFGHDGAPPWKFHRGALHGLVDITPDSVNIIAVHSEEKGNGEFEPLIATFEEVCDQQRVPLRIVEVMNPKLGEWFERRGYIPRISREFGAFVEREAQG